MDYKQIRKLRMDEDLSLPKLAEILNSNGKIISMTYLSELERGKKTSILNLKTQRIVNNWINNAQRRANRRKVST